MDVKLDKEPPPLTVTLLTVKVVTLSLNENVIVACSVALTSSSEEVIVMVGLTLSKLKVLLNDVLSFPAKSVKLAPAIVKTTLLAVLEAGGV